MQLSRRFATRCLRSAAALGAAMATAAVTPVIAVAQEGNTLAGASGPTMPRAPDRPGVRTWNVRDKTFLTSFAFFPGIPEPGKVVEVTVRLNEMPKQRHPRFGSRIPIRKARVTVEVATPSGKTVGRYLAHPLPRAADRYAFHVTPTTKGIHVLRLKATTEDGRSFTAEVKMPVAVWPLPDELRGTGAPTDDGLTFRRPLIKK